MHDAIKVIGLDFVNAFLLKTEDGYMLIDTGLPDLWEKLEEELISVGCLPDQLKLVIITHGDWDHAGNAGRLREKYNIRVAMHPGDVNQVENGVILKRKVSPLLHRLLFTIMMLRRKLQKNKMSFPKFKPDILLSDGQSLEEYGSTAKVIHIPGHTPGSIGVITDEGDLFAGDTFTNRKKPGAAGIVENSGQLKHSLDKLRKMNIKTVYPGHGKPFLMEEYRNAQKGGRRGEKMKKSILTASFFLAVLLLAVLFMGQTTTPKTPGFHLINKSVLGGEGGWDYLALEPESRILYVTHGTAVELFHVDSGVKGEPITGLQGVHGVAFAPKLGRGYISNGRANSVTVFDLKTQKKLGEVMTGANPDAILYDAFSNRVFTFNGRSADATAINAADNTVAGTIPLGGKPEFAQADEKGAIFVNIEDTSEIAVIDARELKVPRRWKLTPGEEPSGLAYDGKNKRLFSVCSNKLLAVSDSVTGAVVATVAIGNGPDAVRFDSRTGLIFSSNGEGTLTVIQQESADKYVVLETVPTARGAHTMELDSSTHHLFLVTAEFGPTPPATTENQRPRPSIVPGSFQLLELGK